MVTGSMPVDESADHVADPSGLAPDRADQDRPIDEQAILRTVARLRSAILALVLGTLGGAGIFTATAWLIVKGGEDVGAHLQLLGQYFIGYSVTWPGSIVGAVYGFIVGAVMGASIGSLYNRIVDLRGL